MRCSKCQYITFDQSDRCRNCGYEFSLTVEDDVLDLPIKTGNEPAGPLADFSLLDIDLPEPPATPQPASRREAPAASARSAASGELPLFRSGSRDDDAPLVSLPATPRAPVSVRKSTVANRPPHRPVIQDMNFDLDPTPEEDDDALDLDTEAGDELPTSAVHRVPRVTEPTTRADAAPIFRRLLAAIVDLTLLVGIDAMVLHFTLRLCGLQLAEAASLPLIPFGAFIALLNGGYVAAFTAAGGQTIGKMLAGIRVVTSEEGAWTDRVPVGPSALRALGYLLSALPAGLGFVPVLLGAERRGLHDRLAHTRVVRA